MFDQRVLIDANPAARQLFSTAQQAPSPTALPQVDDALATAASDAADADDVVDAEIAHHDRHLLARAIPTGDGRVVVVLTDITAVQRVQDMRRDFVTNASHELKTPAASMQALAESIAVAIDRDPPRARQMIDRLSHEAMRLSTLVRDLLDLARLEDPADSRAQTVDLAAMVGQQLDRFAELARQRDVTVDDRRLAPVTIVAPPEDVRLVVANLIENALRYNHHGGHVRLAAHIDGDRAVLEVADTGIGIAETDQPRIFERFYRVDKARSRAAGGTGLGLSLVRHALQRNGGEIAVTSTLGAGSTFRVTLPIDQSAQPSSRSPVTT